MRSLDNGESLKVHKMEETRPAFHVSKTTLTVMDWGTGD